MLEHPWTAPYFSISPNGIIKPTFLIEYFQELAGLDVIPMGMTVQDLIARGMTWVLRRYHMRFSHSFFFNRRFIIHTHHEPYKNLFSQRIFNVKNEAGTPLCFAWSSWILLDIERQRPLRLDRAATEAFYRSSADTGERFDEKICCIDKPNIEINFKVRRSELDMNGHVNHTVYFDWVQESVPQDVLNTMCLCRVDAEFLFPVTQTNVRIRTQELEYPEISLTLHRRFLHSISAYPGDKSSYTEHARLSTDWQYVN